MASEARRGAVGATPCAPSSSSWPSSYPRSGAPRSWSASGVRADRDPGPRQARARGRPSAAAERARQQARGPDRALWGAEWHCMGDSARAPQPDPNALVGARDVVASSRPSAPMHYSSALRIRIRVRSDRACRSPEAPGVLARARAPRRARTAGPPATARRGRDTPVAARARPRGLAAGTERLPQPGATTTAGARSGPVLARPRPPGPPPHRARASWRPSGACKKGPRGVGSQDVLARPRARLCAPARRGQNRVKGRSVCCLGSRPASSRQPAKARQENRCCGYGSASVAGYVQLSEMVSRRRREVRVAGPDWASGRGGRIFCVRELQSAGRIGSFGS